MTIDQGDNDGTEPDVSDYQAELSERTKGGAGCAEMWETLGEERSTDGVESHSRRKLVGIVGMAALGLGITGGSASAGETNRELDSAERPRVDVVTVDDKRTRNELKKRAFSSSDFQEIRSELQSNGWRPEPNNLVVSKTVTEGQVEQYTLTLPFTSNQVEGDASVTWTDNADLETFGLSSEEISDSERLFKKFAVRESEITVSENRVTEAEIRDAMAAQSNDMVTTASIGRFPLCTWNTSCIGNFAQSLGGLVGCCGVCASVVGAGVTGGTACICCVLSGIGFVSIECNVCR